MLSARGMEGCVHCSPRITVPFDREAAGRLEGLLLFALLGTARTTHPFRSMASYEEMADPDIQECPGASVPSWSGMPRAK